MSRARILGLPALFAALFFTTALAQEKKDPPAKAAPTTTPPAPDAKPVPTPPPDVKPVVPPAPDTKPVVPPIVEPKKVEPKASEPNPLGWKFKLNEPFYQEMTTKTSQTIKVQGLDTTQSQSQVFYFKWVPIKIDGDLCTLEQTIEGLKINIDIANSPVQYDSTQEKDTGATSALSDFFKALKLVKFTIVLNTKTMKVEKPVEGRKEFLDKLAPNNKDMKELLESVLTDESFKQMCDPTFGLLPADIKKPGDSWEVKQDLSLGGLGSFSNAYKLTWKKADDKNKDLQLISVDSMKVDYVKPTNANSKLPFKITGASLKGELKEPGDLKFNSAKGWLQEGKLNMKMSGDISIEVSGVNTKVELSQEQETKLQTAEKSLLPEPAKK